jgi:hypothetical protein
MHLSHSYDATFWKDEKLCCPWCIAIAFASAYQGRGSQTGADKSKITLILQPPSITKAQNTQGNHDMADVTIVYWRDIPAQVIVGKGRRGAKAQLPERFEQAIDRAAMKIGASDTDSYLAEWRKADPYPVDGDAIEVCTAEVVRLDAEYDQQRLKTLIDNEGWA